MAYNKILNERIRVALCELPDVQEKTMFGGVCHMVNGKMCLGIVGDEMMCRIGMNNYERALSHEGCREMTFSGKSLKGYVLVSEESLRTNDAFHYWVHLSLAFNPEAKASGIKKK